MARDPRYDERSEAVTEVRREERRPPPQGPWWQENWWVFLVVLLLLVGAIVLFFVFAGDDEDDGAADRAIVPEVVGLQEEQATELLREAGFSVEVVREPSDEVEEGVVAAQAPGAGSRLAAGEVVRIDVSTGPEEVVTETVTETQPATQTQPVEEEPATVAMPDVTGQAYADAAATLIEAGLIPDGFAVPDAAEAGTVVAQDPDPGAEVEEGTQVRLNVSTGGGERPEQEVPDLTGPALAEAYQRCAEAEFTCRVVLREAPSPEEVGEVIDQRPAAGATAPRWAQITLAVGTEP